MPAPARRSVHAAGHRPVATVNKEAILMANLALPRARSQRPHGCPKRALLAAIALVVLALMALSFAVGRGDDGQRRRTATPQVSHVQRSSRTQPATRGGLDCHEHEQC